MFQISLTCALHHFNSIPFPLFPYITPIVISQQEIDSNQQYKYIYIEKFYYALKKGETGRYIREAAISEEILVQNSVLG
jgi:hypothetical protein